MTALALVLVGFPVLLLRFGGSPWPSTVPSLTAFGDQLLRPDTGQLLLAVLLWIAWLGWACFTTSVLTEILAQARHRATPRLVGLGAIQRLAGGLVAAAILTAPSSPLAFAVTAPSAQVTSTQQNSSMAPQPASVFTQAAASARKSTGKEYVVQPARHGSRDSLWSIAERHLGDPLRWREIAELNRGRTQPDGRSLEDPHWIFPGWHLLMPADATGLQPPEQRAARKTAVPLDRPTAEPKTGLTELLPPLPTSRADVPATAGQRSPTSPVGSAQPHEGEDLTQITPSLGPATKGSAGRDGAAPEVSVGALVGGGGGILAAGVLVALARRRIHQRRRRPTGMRMARPAPQLASQEVALRVLAEPDGRDFLDLALRSLSFLLSQDTTSETRTLPEIHAARLTDQALELYLPTADDGDAPPPFRASDDGHIWTVAKNSDLPLDGSTRGDVLAPYPALVPVGRDDVGLVLIDLEGVGSVALVGEPDNARQLLHWVAAEVALGDWSDYLHAFGVGLPNALERLHAERLEMVDELDEKALLGLERRSLPNVLLSRMSSGGEGIMPELLLLSSSPNDEQAARLRANTGDVARTGVGVLVAGEWPAAAWTLTVTSDGRMTVPGFGTSVLANRLDDPAIQVLLDLLDSTARPGQMPTTCVVDEPEPAEQDAGIRPDQRATISAEGSSASDRADPSQLAVSDVRDRLDEEVEVWFDKTRTDIPRVKIMGATRVSAPGRIESGRTSACSELIAYMATHGRRVEEPAHFDLVLWPERSVLLRTRTEAIARARTWLGDDPDGQPRLSKGHGGALHLAPSVLLDWDLFQQLARRGMAAGAAGAEDLATALKLVRGTPFANVPRQRYAWVAETFLEQDIPSAVVDVAHRLAELRRLAGDVQGARAAARAAQLVDRYDERPWRDLLESEHQLGNTGAVRSLVTDLMTTLELEEQDELAPETNELIARVLPRRRTAS